jgi:hypothetical protein
VIERDLYRLMEQALRLEIGVDTAEALGDGLLIVVDGGQEFWVTAEEQPA